nr:hypothetical protein [Bacteroidota bacterium]
MRHTKNIFTILFFLMSTVLSSQPINIDLARQYFREARTLAAADDGEKWGLLIDGPFVFVEKETRFGVANQPVPVESWTNDQDIWYGQMPDKMGFANTSFDWEGNAWSMVVFSHLSDEPKERACLMMHELFHQFQSEIGLQPEYEKGNHLSEKEARIWIQLEWNALLEACHNTDQPRKKAITDAIAFRKHRFNLYPDAQLNEAGKEIKEGTAEYTGMTMCGFTWDEKLAFMQEKIDSLTNTMVWTFAYITGPLYGFLLDEQIPGWTRNIESTSEMATILAEAYEIDNFNTDEQDLIASAKKYGYNEIIEKENTRAVQIEEVMKNYRTAFSEKPVLFFPNKKMKIQFDPRRMYPIEGIGSLYQVITALAEWGKLEVSDYGAVVLEGWKGLLLPVGEGWSPENPVSTKDWTLTMDDDYHIISDDDNWKVELKHEAAERIESEKESLINGFLANNPLVCPVDTSISINFGSGARKQLNKRFVTFEAPLEASDLWGTLIMNSGKFLLDLQHMKLYLKNPEEGTGQEITG